MDNPNRTPLLDQIRRGDAPPDVRHVAALGELEARASDQLALWAILLDDPDLEIRAAAATTIAKVAPLALSAALARPEVSDDTRGRFLVLGVGAGPTPSESDDPFVELTPASTQEGSEPTGAGDADAKVDLGSLTVPQKLKVAMRGTREQRGTLIRDPNKLVSAAVLSSPKLTESEVESFARMANVAEDVLRIIAMNRAWTRNYAVASALVKNPKTPLALSLPMLPRLNERDVKALAVDRNVPEAIRIAARKFVSAGAGRRS